jgi:small nuclear ribonucleoprotein
MTESRPFDTLSDAVGSNVMVQHKTGKVYTGTLKSFDKHINLVLEQAEEQSNGETQRQLGTVFLRGDTVSFITLQ